jgi:hypothetical protein
MNPNRAMKLAELAKAVALDIDRPNRHVSLIYSGPSLLAVGTNRRKTHTLAQQYGYLFNDMHSELDAWIKIRHMNPRKLTLVNFHFNKHSEMKLAKPCRLCLPWVVNIFDKILYSTSDGVERMV